MPLVSQAQLLSCHSKRLREVRGKESFQQEASKQWNPRESFWPPRFNANVSARIRVFGPLQWLTFERGTGTTLRNRTASILL